MDLTLAECIDNLLGIFQNITTGIGRKPESINHIIEGCYDKFIFRYNKYYSCVAIHDYIITKVGIYNEDFLQSYESLVKLLDETNVLTESNREDIDILVTEIINNLKSGYH